MTPRQRFALAAALLIPLGIATKFYAGPADTWVRNHAGGVVYVVFWCMVVFAIRPTASPLRVCAAVFAVTCALEFSQLWKAAFLVSIRSTFVGHALIGSAFSWWDFPYYVIGGGLSFVALLIIQRFRARP